MKILLFACAFFLLSSPSFSFVGINQRALLVVSELDSGGAPELKPLYTILENLTQLSTEGIVGLDYERLEFLTNRNATMANFKREIQELSARAEIKAIDVILSVHGSRTRLRFDDRSWSMSEIEKELGSLGPLARKKLRVMYNLSCWGALHNATMRKIGFDTSTGSVGVNANSEVEYVPALTSWKVGRGFMRGFATSNSTRALFYADAPVRLLGRIQNNSLKETNSRKVFAGRSDIRIWSDPN